MGHSDIGITEQYYLSVLDEDKLDAVNKIVQFSTGENQKTAEIIKLAERSVV